MLTCISSIVASWLITSGVVKSDNRELYEYATYSFLFSCTPLFISIVIGSLLNMTFESLLVICPIVIIRKFSGGFHLNSPWLCFCVSILLLSTSFLFIKYYKPNIIVLSFIVALDSIWIYVKSPIISKARPLKPKEILMFRKATQLFLSLCLITYICFAFFKQQYATPVGIGIIIAAFLQQLSVFMKR